jgi:hypothetical protein
MNLSKSRLSLLAGLLTILLFVVSFRVAQAIPVSFDWGSFDSAGSTNYGVYDTDNSTVLPTGSLVQFIWAGSDGVIHPPACDGSPGGDDQLLGVSFVNNGAPFPPTMQNKGYVALSTYTYDSEDPQQGGVVYMRAWNAASVSGATAYGDSATAILTNGGTLNAPRFHTNTPFALASWNGADGADWAVGSNWSSGAAPSAEAAVTIPAGQPVLSGDVSVRCLHIASGAAVDLAAFDMAVADSLINAGTLRQTKPVNNSSADFLYIQDAAESAVKYRGVTVESVHNLGDVTVAVRAIDPSNGEYCTATGSDSPLYAERCYQISAVESDEATITLWALDTELQGINPDNLTVYRFVAGFWNQLANSEMGSDGGDYVFVRAITPGFSSFLLGDANLPPTTIRLMQFGARASAVPATSLLVLASLLLGILTAQAYRRR